MAIATLHGIDKIVFGSSFTLSAITSVRVTTGIEDLMFRPGSHIAPMSSCNVAEKPRIFITTPEIDTVLAALSLNGLASASDAVIYQKLKSETGAVARATTSHTTHTVSLWLLYWTRINLPHNAEGTIDLELIPVYDGSNSPIVAAGSVALSGNLSSGNRFGAGPVSINGTAISGVQSIEVTSGCVVQEAGASSETWTTYANVQQVNPMVRINTKTISMTTWGASGTTLNGTTGLSFGARRLRSANGSSHHIVFTGLDGAVLVDEESGQGTDDIEAVLRARLTSASDSVMPLTYSTAQTLSA